MIRNLKTLGLALMAVLALTAVAASSASAQTNGKLTTDGTQVTLLGKETGGTGLNAFTAFGGKTECPGSTYTGHKVLTQEQTEAGTKHGYLSNGESSVTITPHYINCTTYSGGTFPSTVDMNGCDFEFHLGETVAGLEDTYKVKSTVVCPPGKHIQLTQFSSSSHAFRVCTVTITHDVNGYNGLHARATTGTGKIDISGTIEGIKADRTGLCGAATDEKAILHQDIEVEGRNALGSTTTISLSH